MAQTARVTPLKAQAFQIETDVPPPAGSRWNPSPINGAIAALAEAAIGASVLIAPIDKPTTFQQAAYRLGGRGWIASRKEADGWRVWKMAEPKKRSA